MRAHTVGCIMMQIFFCKPFPFRRLSQLLAVQTCCIGLYAMHAYLIILAAGCLSSCVLSDLRINLTCSTWGSSDSSLPGFMQLRWRVAE